MKRTILFFINLLTLEQDQEFPIFIILSQLEKEESTSLAGVEHEASFTLLKMRFAYVFFLFVQLGPSISRALMTFP